MTTPTTLTLVAPTLFMLTLGCRAVPTEIHEPEPVGVEAVQTHSLVRSDGRVGPDPDAPTRVQVVSLLPDPLQPFSGEPLERTVDPDGLVIATQAPGTGPDAQAGDLVRFHYVATLEDGREFDSSHDREAFEFALGSGHVIVGLERGLVGAQAGMLIALTIPPALGYGDRGVGATIPGGSTLKFYIEVLEVEPSLDP